MSGGVTLYRTTAVWDGPQQIVPNGPWQLERPRFAEAVQELRVPITHIRGPLGMVPIIDVSRLPR